MSRSVAARTPFVAREEQVSVLLAAVDRAAAGEPGLVLLGADAGVGKTRLLTHTGRLARERTASTWAGSACPTCRSRTRCTSWSRTAARRRRR
jgi:predicted ATP-dependent serine protease